MKHKKITGMLMAVMLLTVAFVVMATPVSAETRVYAEKKVIYYDYSKPWYSDERYHIGLLYPVSLRANENACIGGVDQADLNKYAPEHSNLREWTRKPYGSSKSILLIPKRYASQHWGFVEEIYLAFPSSRTA